MPNLLAMSFEGELTPSFDLKCLKAGGRRPDGWGLGYYPAGEPSTTVLKEARAGHGGPGQDLAKAWEFAESSTFLLHIRSATWGSLTDANTQPFKRTWGGREWLFAHSGSLNERPSLGADPRFEPVGSTDSELVLCDLMNHLAASRWRTLGEADPTVLCGWLRTINQLGTLNVVFTDGRDTLIYSDMHKGGLELWELTPPYESVVFGDEDLSVDLTRRGTKSRKGIIVCSRRLTSSQENQAAWRPLGKGQLLILRQGVIRADVPPLELPEGDQAQPPPVRTRVNRPKRAEVQMYDVRHRTVYRYETPVERSLHLFRLVPAHDRLQTLISSTLNISVEGQSRDYEDVFGNHARSLRVDTPFTEMIIEAKSRVQLLDTDPLAYRPLRARASIPLVWMPWQRQLLNPFLLPPELPETELTELTEYAMSFVERNDYDLLDTLLDINASIFREYRYVQGSTTLATTAFEVYVNRQGVCQDFANLFICLARLLGVPARYVCGYIYTGPKHANQRQAEASHAWVQVYLPEAGWKGFDPTNGILTQTEHIRVATGRSYQDCTPTSGTIFVGGGPETLEVDVRVEPVSNG